LQPARARAVDAARDGGAQGPQDPGDLGSAVSLLGAVEGAAARPRPRRLDARLAPAAAFAAGVAALIAARGSDVVSGAVVVFASISIEALPFVLLGALASAVLAVL